MHRRVYRALRLLPSVIAFALALIIWFPSHASAATAVVKAIRFTEATYTRGYSYTVADTDDKFTVRIEAGTLPGAATVLIERLEADELPVLASYNRESMVFRISVVDPLGQPVIPLKPILLDFSVPNPGYATGVYKLLADGTGWESLGTSLLNRGSKARAADAVPAFTVVLFQHETVMEGTATYYGTYTRTTKLTMVAASNHFAYGELVKVTNLDNGKSVKVKIVDTGGFKFPTVIDLSTPSFAKIQPTWKGVARVRVESTEPGTDDPPPPSEPEPISAAPKSDGATPPTTAAYASIVVDQATGQRLVGKNYDTSMPIASLTKLVSASVFLDTKPDLTNVVTYTSADNTTCSCLRLADGEQVILKDLLYGSLVGSANNATLALVRATGMTRSQFIGKMNEKVASFGLRNTSFVDPTGLESGNVSSASDLAVFARMIPDRYPTIKKILGTGSYKFTSKNKVCHASYKDAAGSCSHSFKTTNKLYGKTSFKIVAAKTGYIDESRHTFMLRGSDAKGHELVLVLLKVYNKTDSFNNANNLMNWTFKHYTWS